MADIIENICEAVDVIVERRLSSLQFDKTITAIIQSIDGTAEEGKENKYIVTDGTTQYTVYSNNVYKENTSVYVSIPNGDYNQKKFIVGYNLGEKETDTVFTVADDFIDLTGSIVGQLGPKSLLANGMVFESDIATVEKINLHGYTTMMLSAVFETELGSIGAEDGTYGLKGYIQGFDKQGSIMTADIDFSSKDMFGAVYNFEGGYIQYYPMDISEFSRVDTVALKFYQNGDFVNSLGKKIPVAFDGMAYEDNLLVRNIELSFGYKQNDLNGKDTLFIFPDYHGQVYYSDNQTKSEDGTMFARWIHKDNEGNFVEFNKMPTTSELQALGLGTLQDFQLDWYVENPTNSILEETRKAYILSDLKLERIATNTFEVKYFTSGESSLIDLKKNTNKIKAAIKYFNEVEYNKQLPKDLDLESDEGKKQIATYKDIYTITIKSADLVYSDLSSVSAEAAVEKATGIKLVHTSSLDKYKGVYNIYRDGQLMSSGDKAIERVLVPQFKRTDTKFKEGDTVTWRVPCSVYTMINSDEIEAEIVEGYKTITKTVELVDNSIDEKSYRLVYKIKPDYKPIRDVDNTIYCTVTAGGVTYDETSVELKFGNIGTIGTNYGIEISLNYNGNQVFAMPASPTGDVILTAKAIHSSGTNLSAAN